MRWRGLRFDDEERVWKWLSSELLNPGTGLGWGWTVRSARRETHDSFGIHSLDIVMPTLSPDVDQSPNGFDLVLQDHSVLSFSAPPCINVGTPSDTSSGERTWQDNSTL